MHKTVVTHLTQPFDTYCIHKKILMNVKTIKLILLSTIFIISLGCESDEQSTQDEQSIVNSMDCIPTNLQTFVAVYYPFTDGSINDFSGNNQDLINTTNASSSSDRNGNENCSFEFDFLSGTNEFLSTSNNASLDILTDFSISLWYQPLQERDNGEYELLIGRGLDFRQWNLGLYDCRKAVFGWTSSVWDNDPNFECGISDFNNDWHHLVATYDNQTNTMVLYRNGVLQSMSNTIYNQNASQIEELIIGNEYTGKIDDIIIFNKSLSQSEINSLFNMDSCCE